MGNHRKDLEELKSLVSTAVTAPGKNISEIRPEIRSDIKWAPVQTEHLAPGCPTLLVSWRFGVPWADVPEFHQFLDADEATIKNHVDGHSGGKVKYLGTYVNLDGGIPMYETLWGYFRADFDTFDWTTLVNAGNSAFRRAVKKLRKYWADDPSRSEHRFGLAANYRSGGANAKLPKDPFLD